MDGKRVVVTGMGTMCPVGVNVRDSWDNIKNGRSGITKITRFDVSEMSQGISKVAGEVKYGDSDDTFNPDKFIEKKEQRKMDRFIWYAIAAAHEAIASAGWAPSSEEDLMRTGVMIGSGIGGLEYIQNTCKTLFEKGIDRISPFFVPASIINLASGAVSIRHGFRGPNSATVTACASSTHAIGDAAQMIKRGIADVMIAGGAEGPVCELGVGGFSAMRALSTKYNDEPERASRPWDRDRDGFVIAEGAGILVLEEYEHAKKRGAKIYAEVAGYGMGGDAYHITSPEPTGRGQKLAMLEALRDAGMNPEDIGYINAHGTSTPAGDGIEFASVREVFSSSLGKISMSSTKSATGHLLGGAGALEAVLSIEAMNDGILPPTLNLDNPGEDFTGIDLVPLVAKEKKIQSVLSNSFGFGGTNASLIFKKI